MGNKLVVKKDLNFLPKICGRLEKYKILTLLGNGAFGFVTLVKGLKTKKLYACKNVNRTKLIKMNPSAPVAAANEVTILKKVGDHEMFIKTIELFTLKYNPINPDENKDVIFDCLIVELCELGDIDHMIEKTELELWKCCYYFQRIIEGFVDLHAKNIVHLDMKLDNLLLKENEAGQVVVKISDFGSSFDLDSVKTEEEMAKRMTNMTLGNIFFTSPEILVDKKISTQNDVFSLGLIFFCCLYRISNRQMEKLFQDLFKREFLDPKSEHHEKIKKMFNLKELNEKMFFQFMKYLYVTSREEKEFENSLFWKGIILPVVCPPTLEGNTVVYTNEEKRCFQIVLKQMLDLDLNKRKSCKALLQTRLFKSFELILQNGLTNDGIDYINLGKKGFNIISIFPFVRRHERVNQIFNILSNKKNFTRLIKLRGIVYLGTVMNKSNFYEVVKVFLVVMLKEMKKGKKGEKKGYYKKVLQSVEKVFSARMALIKNFIIAEDNNLLYTIIYLLFKNHMKSFGSKFKNYIANIAEKINHFNDFFIYSLIELLAGYVSNEKDIKAILDAAGKVEKKKSKDLKPLERNILFLSKYKKKFKKDRLLNSVLNDLKAKLESKEHVVLFICLVNNHLDSPKKINLIQNWVKKLDKKLLERMEKNKTLIDLWKLGLKFLNGALNESETKEIESLVKETREGLGMYSKKMEDFIERLTSAKNITMNKLMAEFKKGSKSEEYLLKVKKVLSEEEYSHFLNLLKTIKKNPKSLEPVVSDLMEMLLDENKKLLFEFKEFLPFSRRGEYVDLVETRIQASQTEKLNRKNLANEYIASVKSKISVEDYQKFREILKSIRDAPKPLGELVKELNELISDAELILDFKDFLPVEKRKKFTKIVKAKFKDTLREVMKEKERLEKEKEKAEKEKEKERKLTEKRESKNLKKQKVEKRKKEEQEKKQKQNQLKEVKAKTKQYKSLVSKTLRLSKKKPQIHSNVYSDLVGMIKDNKFSKFKKKIKGNYAKILINHYFKSLGLVHYAVIFKKLKFLSHLVKIFNDLDINFKIQKKVDNNIIPKALKEHVGEFTPLMLALKLELKEVVMFLLRQKHINYMVLSQGVIKKICSSKKVYRLVISKQDEQNVLLKKIHIFKNSAVLKDYTLVLKQKPPKGQEKGKVMRVKCSKFFLFKSRFFFKRIKKSKYAKKVVLRTTKIDERIPFPLFQQCVPILLEVMYGNYFVMFSPSLLYPLFLVTKKLHLSLFQEIVVNKLNYLKFNALIKQLYVVLDLNGGHFTNSLFELKIFKLFCEKYETELFSYLKDVKEEFKGKGKENGKGSVERKKSKKKEQEEKFQPFIIAKISELMMVSDYFQYFKPLFVKKKRQMVELSQSLDDFVDGDEEEQDDSKIVLEVENIMEYDNLFYSTIFNNIGQFMPNYFICSNDQNEFKIHKELLVMNCSNYIFNKLPFLKGSSGSFSKSGERKVIQMDFKVAEVAPKKKTKMKFEYLDEKELLFYVKFLYTKKISKCGIETLGKFILYSNRNLIGSYLIEKFEKRVRKKKGNPVKVLLRVGYLLGMIKKSYLPDDELYKRIDKLLRTEIDDDKFYQTLIDQSSQFAERISNLRGTLNKQKGQIV